MSRFLKDIFDLVAHGMFEILKPVQLNLRMVQVSSKTSESLFLILERFNLKPKIIAYLTDTGTNLIVCTNALSHFMCCENLSIEKFFDGFFFAHILSNASKASMASETYENIKSVIIKSVMDTLQRCITWTKRVIRVVKLGIHISKQMTISQGSCQVQLKRASPPILRWWPWWWSKRTWWITVILIKIHYTWEAVSRVLTCGKWKKSL